VEDEAHLQIDCGNGAFIYFDSDQGLPGHLAFSTLYWGLIYRPILLSSNTGGSYLEVSLFGKSGHIKILLSFEVQAGDNPNVLWPAVHGPDFMSILCKTTLLLDNVFVKLLPTG
jgi:hypothetical protein